MVQEPYLHENPLLQCLDRAQTNLFMGTQTFDFYVRVKVSPNEIPSKFYQLAQLVKAIGLLT